MNLKYDTNDPIYEPNRITVMKHRLVVAQGVGVGEGIEREAVVSRCKLEIENA